jgi:mercuric ion transport protein
MKVEVLYFEGCPNYHRTTTLVRQAIAELGVDAEVEEIEVRTPQDAERLGFLGSPTVHVDGVDIDPSERESTVSGFACRTYAGRAVPPREMIIAALRGGQCAPAAPATRGRLRAVVTALAGTGALLLPIGTCPACWPAYAGVLSALGLGFLLSERYLMPLAAVLLLGALSSLLYGASSRRGYGPFMLGIGGCLTVLTGELALSSDSLAYTGLALFVVAAGWNAWPEKKAKLISCERCVSQEGSPTIAALSQGR